MTLSRYNLRRDPVKSASLRTSTVLCSSNIAGITLLLFISYSCIIVSIKVYNIKISHFGPARTGRFILVDLYRIVY